VFEGNYHRSLDHRSFYFKQVDKRHLGAKGMIQVRSTAAGQRASSPTWSVGAVSYDAGWAPGVTKWLSGRGRILCQLQSEAVSWDAP